MSKDSFGVPSELCFDKNEFTKKSFSVDSFLHEYRHAGTLEQIRDDLGLYLKTLRSEMIELINADYADFVSLSAKLTGLDQSIGTIESPLKGLREELVTIKSDLHLAMEQIEKCLKDKEQLQQLKHSLQCITLLASTSRNLEQLLGAVDQYSADSIHVERVVGLLCHQTNYLESCEKYLKPDQLHTVKTLATQSMDLLKHFFIEAIRGSHKKNLECSLRLYSMLNATGTAESIYRSDVVKPHMSKLISEQSLQNSPKGVNGIYDQIIAFIDTNMKDLLQLSSQVDERRYDFLLHSFWPEVEHRLEVNMSSIFAPGNPNFFYQKYQATVEFLVKFETYTPHPEVLRRHKQYKSFMKRWNLPVYFQIRFQEMGGAVETELSKKFTSALIRPADSVIRLSPVAVALDNVTKCWTEGIYLDPLLAKFLKLTLQIYARLNGWIGEIIKDSSITLELSRTEFMMLIYGDLQRVKMSVPPLITQVQNLMKCAANVSIDRCFSDALGVVKTNENLALAEVVREMLERSQTGIRQVTDIPRLYRKTNREMPTKPCPYVEEMVGPVKEFQTKYGQAMETQHMNETLTSVLSQINAQYFCAVDEVLTSVQKTEESLRRLKTLREKSTPQTASSTSNVTDDDKIRAQFFVDVGHWSSRIEEMGIPREAVDRLPALLSLVNQFSISR